MLWYMIKSDLLKWFSIAENVSEKAEKLWVNLVIKPKIFPGTILMPSDSLR